MNTLKLERQSERYGQFGSISAQGIQKLLGAPSHDRLQIVIRESIQNSWDAVADPEKAEYRVGIRSLTSEQIETLRTTVFNERDEAGKKTSLDVSLGLADLKVLELSDFGSSGLGGPVDASIVTDEDEVTDYVDFVRNIGSPRDTDFGGGTYGYGKSSLYGASKCQTILIDSLTMFEGREERRLIGVRIASSFSIRKGENKGKYTGRHWWGRFDDNQSLLTPLSGEDAEHIAIHLGFPERGPGDLGTSIMILDPMIDEEEDVLNTIQRTILWNFWPKMVAKDGHRAPMHFQTYLDDLSFDLPAPELVPPLNIFAETLQAARSERGEIIKCKNPKADLGVLATSRQPIEDRITGFGPSENDDMFPEVCRHVALMRPVELVVKYLEGPPLPSTAIEWAGTFITSREPEIEEAFAAAEPPAHDDWIPDFLSKRWEKTFVRTALRRIREQMNLAIGPKSQAHGDSELPLASLSQKLGGLLGRGTGDGLGVVRTPGSRGGGGSGRRKAKTFKIRNLSGWGPGPDGDGRVLAWFDFQVEGPPEARCRISGKPGVYIDGENSEVAPNGKAPEVVVWLDADESVIGNGAILEISMEDASNIRVGVTIPDNVAITFEPEIETV